MAYPNLKNEDPTLFKITTEDDEIKELKYKKEKHDHGNILKILKIDNDYYQKNRSLNKKILLIITERMIGSGSAIFTAISTLINAGVSYSVHKQYSFFLTSTATLITNEKKDILYYETGLMYLLCYMRRQ